MTKKFSGVETRLTQLQCCQVEWVLKDGSWKFKELPGTEFTLDADIVLVSIGCIPFTGGLGLEEAGIARDERGRVTVDAQYRTSMEGVYAIGDVIAGPMLAHKAEDEGVAVAEILAGQAGHVNYGVIPNVVYTEPEIATVGMSEEAARETTEQVVVKKFPFRALGKAHVINDTGGFVKLIGNAKTGELLGCQIIGPSATELIEEAVVAIQLQSTVDEIAHTIHPHPTLSESVMEAAESWLDLGIHS